MNSHSAKQFRKGLFSVVFQRNTNTFNTEILLPRHLREIRLHLHQITMIRVIGIFFNRFFRTTTWMNLSVIVMDPEN